MLTEIYLKNFTIVKQLRLVLQSGLSVLSGETGAGKSIVIDAVSLCLGARADSKVIRHGEQQCEISLAFDLSHIPAAQQWLITHDFSSEGDCIIARTLQHDGRSRSSINGKPASSNVIRALAQQLISIHGQHHSQSLLQREQQQHYVDTYGKHQTRLQALQQLYSTWRDNDKQLQALTQLAAQRDQQLEFLRYQLEELQTLDLQENEWQSLYQENQQLHNVQALMAQLNEAIDLTVENEQHSATQLLQHAIAQLNAISHKDKPVENALQLLNNAAVYLQEASDELESYRNKFDLSPERLHFIETRLSQLHDMARKHHSTPEKLPAVTESLQQQVTQLENSDESIAQLQTEQQQLVAQYQIQANQLTTFRKAAAKKIDKQITGYMQTLGMKGGEFKTVLTAEPNTPTPHGNEKLHFEVRTNPGQGMQALNKVVSGGELSRISLALQTIIAQQDNIPTFIFDEVDVGIGGATAEMVGKLLKQLGKTTQLYCITHLPQVAAQGDHHYKVVKSTDATDTITNIHSLDSAQRIQELARMMSGSKITQQTLEHAEQLLQGANHETNTVIRNVHVP